MRSLPQQDHCDLGLIDDDKTPEMRQTSGCHPRPSVELDTHHLDEEKF